MVISGGNFKPDTLKPKEVVSLLLDDEEIEQKCKKSIFVFKKFIENVFIDRQKTEERKHQEDLREMDRKRKQMMAFKVMNFFFFSENVSEEYLINTFRLCRDVLIKNVNF